MMQQKSTTIKVKYPPSANRLWRVFNGHLTKSLEYRKWLDHSILLAKSQFHEETYKCELHVELFIGVPDKRKRDLDNRIKPCLDLLQASQILEDDSLIHRLYAQWEPNLKDSVVIHIKPLTPTHPTV